jgi:hypothetical protein
LRYDHEGRLVGKKQDKLGRWDEYMRELGRLTKSKSLPREWATPEQRSRAAIKVVTIKRIK